MEHKEIVIVVAAVLLVIGVIAVLSKISGKGNEQETSVPVTEMTLPVATAPPETDIWDRLRASQTTEITEVTVTGSAAGSPDSTDVSGATDENGSTVTQGTGVTESGSAVSGVSVETETTSTSVTGTTTATHAATYTLIIN